MGRPHSPQGGTSRKAVHRATVDTLQCRAVDHQVVLGCKRRPSSRELPSSTLRSTASAIIL
eukprot:8098933-Alexandrium_andersonii.AAC.1